MRSPAAVAVHGVVAPASRSHTPAVVLAHFLLQLFEYLRAFGCSVSGPFHEVVHELPGDAVLLCQLSRHPVSAECTPPSETNRQMHRRPRNGMFHSVEQHGWKTSRRLRISSSIGVIHMHHAPAPMLGVHSLIAMLPFLQPENGPAV